MSNRKVALILSFIYCGLGQIYKGQILKGIDLIVIYTILIVSLFSSLRLLHFFSLFTLPSMWLVGMVDAYMYENIPVIHIKRWLLVILFGAVISVLILCVQTFLVEDGRSGDTQAENQSDGLDSFSIQVAAFKNQEAAEELRNELLNKGYAARVEYPTSAKEKFYRVLIGKFQTKQEATTLAEELRGREGHSYMIVHPVEGDIYIETAPNSDSLGSAQPEDQFDSSEFFSIQVAAFRGLEEAEKFRDKLIDKGYAARVEYPTSAKEKWYRVLIGKYQTKQETTPVAEKLLEQEGFSYIIFHSQTRP